MICVGIEVHLLYAKTLLLGMSLPEAHFCLYRVTCPGCIPASICSRLKKCVIGSVVTLLLNSHLAISQAICSPRATAFVDYVRRLSVCWCCFPSQCSLLSCFIGSCASQSPFPPLIVLILTRYQPSRLQLQ